MEKIFISLTRRPVLATGLALTSGPTPSSPPGLYSCIGSPRRSAANIKRDRYRHPAALLAFGGLTPTQSMIEIEPGGVFGREDHRASAKAPPDPRARSGYVREDFARALIELTKAPLDDEVR